MTKGCGRIDEHPAHRWRVRKSVQYGMFLDWSSRVETYHYWCPGPPVIEGGAHERQ